MIIILGMMTAIIVVLAGFLSIDRYLVKRNLIEELTSLAKVTANRSAVAIVFDDSRNAEENLKGLSVRGSVRASCIYKNPSASDNTLTGHDKSQFVLFASYERNSKTDKCEERYSDRRLSDRIVVIENIAKKDNLVGFITVVSDLSPVQDRTITWLYMSALMFVVAMLFSYLVTRQMKYSIVTPLVKLSTVMKTVSENNDLSLRAKSYGRDEVGELVHRFNDMLDILNVDQNKLQNMYQDLVTSSAKAEKIAADLEARNQQIKDMLSGAAHDLRQPLQAMSIFLDALVLKNNDDALDPLFGKLDLSMQNMQDLFKEILDVSRVENTGNEEAYKEVSFDKLFNSLQVEFNVMAARKGLDIRWRTKGHTIRTMPGIVERIVRNLISNALSYTQKGGVIVVERRRGKSIVIEVWDTGEGIPLKKQDKIFKKFEQLEELGDQNNGYGLGLAIVKQFVDMLKYKIELHSIEGRGTRFRLSIPINHLVPEKIKEVPPPALSVIDYSEKNTSNSNELEWPIAPEAIEILLVDDDDLIRDGIEQLFRAWGVSFTSFGSLNEMRDYFVSGEYTDPDIIVSDYQLGEHTTGAMAVDFVRGATGINIPAIIITGNRSEEVHNAIRSKGLEFLLKPVNAPKLKQKIAEYLADD